MSKKRRGKRTKAPKTLLDIVIPVYGRFDLLTQCIESIPDAVGDIPYHLYIWDNASPDKEEADTFYNNSIDNATVIRNPQNIGFPMGCNKAASRGKSPLIFFLNSDVVLDAGSVDLLVRKMDNPEVGICGMKLVFPNEHAGLSPQARPADKLQHIGLSTNIRGEVVHSFVGWNSEHERVNAVDEVFAVTGAALMIRRNLWTKVKGFDEIFGVGTFEDADLCMKVRELGYNIVVEPKARGIHYTGATSETYQIGYPLGYNHMQFMRKWGDKVDWFDWRIL